MIREGRLTLDNISLVRSRVIPSNLMKQSNSSDVPDLFLKKFCKTRAVCNTDNLIGAPDNFFRRSYFSRGKLKELFQTSKLLTLRFIAGREVPINA